VLQAIVRFEPLWSAVAADPLCASIELAEKTSTGA
jgi:hypothetical protein